MDPILQHVLRSLALNREPGWNFPGNFLDLSFDEVAAPSMAVSLEPGPHCTDASGQIHLVALCVLADVGLASAARHMLGRSARNATVSMTLQFTGAPRTGRLRLASALDGPMRGTRAPQALTRAAIHAGDALVCTGVGTFISLGERGLAALPMRSREASARVPALALDELDEVERGIFDRAESALDASAAAPGTTFLDRFWTLPTAGTPAEGASTFTNGPHAGNRVGHTQGGISVGLAAANAVATLGAGWQLGSCTAAYLAPGTGATLHARSQILHRGGLAAAVHTALRDDAGRLALDVLTQHARLA